MQHCRGWIGISALLVFLGGAQTAAANESDAAYAPIFLMYSGEPSHERLQGLRQFLTANNIPKHVAKDAVDTVIYKLKKFKAGFAYPIFFSENSNQGNACVVADSHYSHAEPAIALMTNERIHRYVLGGKGPAMDVQTVLDTVVNHEIFHCYDLMRQTQIEVGTQVARHGSAYFANWSETGADAFAALSHIRSGGQKQLIRQVRDFRTLNLLNGDAVHYTARTLDYIVWNYDQKRLKQLNMQQLVKLAYTIREQTALTPEEFGLIEQVATRFDTHLRSLTNEIGQHAHPVWQPHLTNFLSDPEDFSQLIMQIRSALNNLGGDISAQNAYFHPLIQKYYRATHVRIEQAALTP